MPTRAEIEARMDMNNRPFKRGVKGAQKSVKTFVGSAIKQFGMLAGAAGFGALATGAINLGSQISDMSEQLRINAESLQTLQAIAVKAGVGQGTLERALRNTSIRTQEAIDGNKLYADSFERLNIDLEEFTKLPTEKKLEVIAQAYAKAGKSQEAFTDVANILGKRAGPQMLEILRRLNDEGLSELQKQAKASGLVMSEEVIAKMDQAADEMGKFNLQLKILTAGMLVKVIPGVRILGNGLGFIGEMTGVALFQIYTFTNFLSKTLGSVVEPSIKIFHSLGKAISAAGKAAKGDLAGAKADIEEGQMLQKEGFRELANLPGEIADNFKAMTAEAKSGMASLGEFIGERSKSIEEDWGTLTGKMVKKTKEDADKMDKALAGVGSDGTGGTGGSSGGSSGKQSRAADEQKIRQYRLDAMKAQAAGDEAAAQALRNRIDFIKRVLEIEQKTTATREEALGLAKEQIKAEQAAKQKPDTDDKMRGKMRTGRIGTGKIGELGGISEERWANFGKPSTPGAPAPAVAPSAAQQAKAESAAQTKVDLTGESLEAIREIAAGFGDE